LEILKTFAEPSLFVCPDCNGGLWEVLDSRPRRYRCHTGHGFTARSLQHEMGVARDQAAWNALRALQEEGLLLEHLAEVHGAAGEHAEAERLHYAAEHVTRQCAVLRSLVEQQPETTE
jgi:two-component system chemotaxis response regulator CheB